MATEKISMSPEQMRRRAGEYTQQANNLQSIINKMDNLLRALQEEWKGRASEAYAVRFNELRPGFVSAKELIDNIAKALDDTARITEETDNAIASQFTFKG